MWLCRPHAPHGNVHAGMHHLASYVRAQAILCGMCICMPRGKLDSECPGRWVTLWIPLLILICIALAGENWYQSCSTQDLRIHYIFHLLVLHWEKREWNKRITCSVRWLVALNMHVTVLKHVLHVTCTSTYMCMQLDWSVISLCNFHFY